MPDRTHSILRRARNERPVNQEPPRHHRDALLLFGLLFLISTYYTHTWVTTNDGSRYALTKAIVTRGTLAVDDVLTSLVEPEKAIDRTEFEGRTYSDKAPVGAMLAVPICALAHVVTARERPHIFLTSLFMSALPFALSGVLLLFIALRAGVQRAPALAMTFLFSAGTNLFYWSNLMFSHALSSFFVLLALYLLLEKPGPRWALLAGVAAGLAVGNDYYLIVLLPGFALYLWFTRREAIAFFVLGSALAGTIPAVYHWIIFGNPWTLPYRHQAHFGANHAAGVYGIAHFRIDALWHLLLAPTYGLLFFNPILLALGYTAPLAWRRDRALTLLWLGWAVVLVLLVGAIDHKSFGLGFSWGPRYLCPLIPVGAAIFLRHVQPSLFRSPVLWILGALSLLLNYVIANAYFKPPHFKAVEFLRWVVGERFYGSGGMSALGHLNMDLGWGLPVWLVAVTNVAVLATPVVVIGAIWFRERRPRPFPETRG